MIATVLTSAISLALLVCWFRYACFLILAARTARNFGDEFAGANHLLYPRVRIDSENPDAGSLDRVRGYLARDYKVIIALSQHAAGSFRLEELLLRLDYAVLDLRYRTFRTVSPRRAAGSLCGMRGIVEYLANSLGERSLCQV